MLLYIKTTGLQLFLNQKCLTEMLGIFKLNYFKKSLDFDSQSIHCLGGNTKRKGACGILAGYIFLPDTGGSQRLRSYLISIKNEAQPNGAGKQDDLNCV